MSGPLNGFKIIEFAGLGPAPFAGMMLSDMGAEILRIDKMSSKSAENSGNGNFDILSRGRQTLTIDLKKPDGALLALKMIEKADALIEGFRPGVMEKLGLGPEKCLKKNQKLVYGRMTGWGQEGPLSKFAGHDINYLSLTGALHSIGRKGSNPTPPLNLVGDFGGGGMFLAFGIVCALIEASKSDKGQVVDAAMVDGVASLMAMVHGLLSTDIWEDKPASNFLDTGSHYYDTYECLDGKYVAVGAIEPKFYNSLVEVLGLNKISEEKEQMDKSRWPELKKKFSSVFLTKTRGEWCKIMKDKDVCFSPVLSITEAYEHPHNKARKLFLKNGKRIEPAPAPRFSRTPGSINRDLSGSNAETSKLLFDWGLNEQEISELLK
ncbi:MAG TPA: CoA transferase [Rhodospirillales bacterium]|nr:CoA transferase [Rhodospirillales bacterium]